MYIQQAQRTGTSKRFSKVPLQKAVNQAKDLAELLPLVVRLSRETELLLKKRGLSESDIRRIAAPLVQIRLLLTAIASSGGGPREVSRKDALVRDMIERYLDLEGRIKEMRNDLAAVRKPSLP